VRHLEDDMQRRFFNVIGIASNRDPILDWIFAIPNGGKRNPKEAARLKAQGVTPGVADVFCPIIGKNDEPGLWIEFKTETGRLSDDQTRFMLHVQNMGYAYRCCYTTEEAVSAVENYLGISIMVHQKSQRLQP
jgi:VRR-NUC domain